MSTKNLKEKLTQYISNADYNALNYLNEAATQYDKRQKAFDIMIAEGEEDIAAGRLHTTEEVFDHLFKNLKD